MSMEYYNLRPSVRPLPGGLRGRRFGESRGTSVTIENRVKCVRVGIRSGIKYKILDHGERTEPNNNLFEKLGFPRSKRRFQFCFSHKNSHKTFKLLLNYKAIPRLFYCNQKPTFLLLLHFLWNFFFIGTFD